MTIFTDANGNSCSSEYFGSDNAAKAALASLVNCTDCRNCRNCSSCSSCSYCSYCRNCSSCSSCSDCIDCRDCSHCSHCSHCSYCSSCISCSDCSSCSDCIQCKFIRKANGPNVIGPFRSDGYQFILSRTGSIHAGCRVFKDFASARAHWQETRGGTKLGHETMAILDYLEAMSKLKDQN